MRRYTSIALVAIALIFAPAAPGAAQQKPAQSPVLKDYVIGIGDLLHIVVWGNKDLEQDVVVRPDGKISYPLAGDLQAKGLTVPQLSEVLTKSLSGAVKSPNVSVMVKEVRSFRVFVVGQVTKPGVYPIDADTPLLEALTLAGGPLPGADLPAAYVIRGAEKIPVNLWQLIQRGDLSKNIPLKPADTVVVPAGGELQNAVYVMGEVAKPGVYAQPDALTLLKLVSVAGGFTKYAAPSRATLIRRDGDKKIVIKVDLKDVMSDPEKQDMPLQPGDVLVVPERLF